jgi:hypothetical protein
MDHTAMTGLVLHGGRLVEHLGYAGRVGRKAAHYRGVYDDVLGPSPSRFSSFGLAAEIARLLDVEAAGGARAAVRWSEDRSAGQ